LLCERLRAFAGDVLEKCRLPDCFAALAKFWAAVMSYCAPESVLARACIRFSSMARDLRASGALSQAVSMDQSMRSTRAQKIWAFWAWRAVLMLIAIPLLARSEPAAAAEKLKLAQNQGPISGISILADRKGLFARNGLDVEVLNFTTGKQCLDTVMGGAADIATTAEAPTTAAAMSGQKIAFLARTEYSYLKTLTATAANIATFADLKGKRLAFTAGTGGEVYTMELLKKAALSKEDVAFVNLRPQDMVAALASGSIDAYSTWEPHIYNGARVLGAKVALLDTKGIYAETFNIVIMQDSLEKRPDAVKNFLKSLVEAEAWLKANPDESIKIVAEFVNMPVSELRPIWQDYVYGVALDRQVLDVLNAHASWRLASGNHPPGATMPDWRKIIFTGPLKAAAPDRVTIFQ
jgi:NitT/TauT family transport system substrate-binding protein